MKTGFLCLCCCALLASVLGCGGDDSGGSTALSFTDLGDGTVKDNLTGLLWQQEDDDTQRIWIQAGQYCQDLDLAGSADWRLPELAELRSIVDPANFNPAIQTDFFPGTKPKAYWSTTQYEAYADYSWYVHFGDGSEHFASRTSLYYGRCVR